MHQLQRTRSVDQSQNVGFCDFIDWPNDETSCLQVLSTFADIYLWFGGSCVEFDSYEGTTRNVTLTTNCPNGFPLWFTIAKVISYATIILPLIALVIKAVVRCIYTFNVTDVLDNESEIEEGQPTQFARIKAKNLITFEWALKENGFPRGLQETATTYNGETFSVETALSAVIDLLNQAPETNGAIEIDTDLSSSLANTFRFYLPINREWWNEGPNEKNQNDKNSWLGRILATLQQTGEISDYRFCATTVKVFK